MFWLNFCGLIERLFVYRGDIEGENTGKKQFYGKTSQQVSQNTYFAFFFAEFACSGKKVV